MQNVVNYLAPFVDSDGKPAALGRVHFLEPDSDSEYIEITDKDGTPIENPLPLDSQGRFSIQPFAGDGIDFKMLVQEPTGMSPMMDDDSMCWRDVCTMYFRKGSVEVSYVGVPSVDSMPKLRTTDPSVGKVLVLGYDSADDWCPPRIFKWEETLLAENYGTHVRSTLPDYASSGTWVLEPSGFVDARWFGLKDNGDATSALDYATSSHPDKAVYVPTGTYTVTSSLTFSALIVDYNAQFFSPSIDRAFSIIRFENRGAKFNTIPNEGNEDSVITPCVTGGTARTSWLSGNINKHFNRGFATHADTVVFDNPNLTQGTEAITIEKKNVLILNAPPSNFTFTHCVVVDLSEAQSVEKADRIRVDEYLQLGPDYSLSYDEDHENVHISYRGNSVIDFGKASVTIPNLVFGILGMDEYNGWKVWNDNDDWDNTKFLKAARAKISSLRVDTALEVGGTANFKKGASVDFDREWSAIDGNTASVDDTKFSSGDMILVRMFKRNGNTGEVYMPITATPTAGRSIKLVAEMDENDFGNFAPHDLDFYVTDAVGTPSNILYAMSCGASVWFVAENNQWKVDYKRI